MAARNIVARLTRKESVTCVRLRGGRWPFPKIVAAVPMPTPTSPAPLISGIRHLSTAPNELHSSPSRASVRSKSLSTAVRPSEDAPPPERKLKSKRSPHSKLLRVCSDRNANSHFAAIEAHLLRLQWQESMDALVEDWTGNDRLDDFIELERNVRAYVDKNLIDLTHMKKECVRQWEREVGMGVGNDGGTGAGREATKPSVSLSDHLRFHHFPYEKIINGIMNRAILGEYAFSSYELKSIGDEDKNGYKRSMVELHGRISSMSKLGKLLDAMTCFDANDVVAATDNDHDDDSMTAEGNDNNTGWTIHHTSCSNCYRSVLSGWFLLFRRLREVNKRILSDVEVDAANVLKATAKPNTHPEFETLVWAKKWIDFCTENNVRGEEGGDGANHKDGVGETLLLGGIVPSDRPLLTGVVKILAMSDNAKHQAQSVELEKRLAELFLHESNM